MRTSFRHGLLIAVLVLAGMCTAAAQSPAAKAQEKSAAAKAEEKPAAPEIPAAALIQAEELAELLQAPGEKPLILYVGFPTLYRGGHIPGAELAGPASDERGKEQLRSRVKSLARNQAIVLYCGCCPWRDCPNIRTAFHGLRAMGFTNVKALYVAENFRVNWIEKGYPTVKD